MDDRPRDLDTPFDSDEKSLARHVEDPKVDTVDAPLLETRYTCRPLVNHVLDV